MSDLKKRKVAVLGARGEIGALVTAGLASRDIAPLVLVGRDHAQLEAFASTLERQSIEVRAADVLDNDRMRDLLSDCGLVVNCSGPSWKTSVAAAQAAVSADASFIDVGGYQHLFDALRDRERNNPIFDHRSFIVSAGWIPGLSEVFSRFGLELAERHGRASHLELVCGARDRWSLASASDMIWHLKHQKEACYYSGGKRRKISSWETFAIDVTPEVGRRFTLCVDNSQFSQLAEERPDLRCDCRLGLLSLRTMGVITLIKSSMRAWPNAAARLLRWSIAEDSKAAPGALGFLTVIVSLDGDRRLTASLVDRRNHWITAQVAVTAARLVLSGQSRPGVAYLGDAVDAGPFMEMLAGEGVKWKVVMA